VSDKGKTTGFHPKSFMSLSDIAWTLIALEILLFFAWLYNLYGPGNGTDPAGRGIGLCFTLALGGYILAGAGLMFLPVGWGVVTVIVMAALPLAIVVIGLIKWLTPRRW
jgi:hypothetical protein